MKLKRTRRLCLLGLAVGFVSSNEAGLPAHPARPSGQIVLDRGQNQNREERDPFEPPAQVTSGRQDETVPLSGLAGVSLADVIVRGTARAGDTVLAILEVPGRRSFLVRPRDRLRDASVAAIDTAGVVFDPMDPDRPAARLPVKRRESEPR